MLSSPSIIDAHVHLWMLARGDYGGLDDGAPAVLKRDFALDDLMPSLLAHGVTKVILVQAAPTFAETQFLLSIAAAAPMVAGVVGWLDLEATDFAAKLQDMGAIPGFVGVRPMLHEHADPAWILRAPVIAALHRLSAADVPIDIVCRADQLQHVEQAIRQVPGLRAVIDHLGSPPITDGNMARWADDISALATLPTVHCKITGLGALARPGWRSADIDPPIAHVLSVFGTARLIWGSDWPASLISGDYGITLEAPHTVLARTLTAAAMASVFGVNAATFYKLPRSSPIYQ